MNTMWIIGPVFLFAIFGTGGVAGIEKYLYSYMNGCRYDWDCDYGMSCVALICEPTIRLYSCATDEKCEPYGMQCINWRCRDPENAYRNIMPGKRRSPGPWSRYLVNRLNQIKQQSKNE